MAIDDRFRAQVDLLLRTIPFIAKEKCFALKGGTAINLSTCAWPMFHATSSDPLDLSR